MRFFPIVESRRASPIGKTLHYNARDSPSSGLKTGGGGRAFLSPPVCLQSLLNASRSLLALSITSLKFFCSSASPAAWGFLSTLVLRFFN